MIALQVAVPKGIAALTKPGCWLLAEKDFAIADAAVAQVKAMIGGTGKGPAAAEFHHYPGTTHG